MRSLCLSVILIAVISTPSLGRNGSSPQGGGGDALPTSTADHNANNVTMTLTDVGAYGYFDPVSNTNVGVGFRFLGFPSALFHGGLVYGTSPTTVSDAAYGSDDNGVTQPFNFASSSAITIGGAPLITQHTCSTFDDSDFDTTPLSVSTLQRSYAWAGDNYIIIDVTLTATDPLNGLFVGLYTDWDVGTLATENMVGYDPGRQLGSMWTQGAGDPSFYGIQLLSHPASGYRAVNNPTYVYPGGTDPGFEDADKFEFFSGFGTTSSGVPDDWSNMISAGPFNLPAAGSVRVAFALLAGSTEAELGTQADQAQARWNSGIAPPCGPPEPGPLVRFHGADIAGPDGLTEFSNDPASEDIIIVRANDRSTWYVVPPGEFATIDQLGEVTGSVPLESFDANVQASPTDVAYKVIKVDNYERSANQGGPYTPIAVNDILVTCRWYRRSTLNTSNLTVVNVATGDTLSCPRLGSIFLITPHHVPEDPRFENIFSYSNLVDFNYAPFDISFDEASVVSHTAIRPNDYQTALRGSHGEAMAPQHSATTSIARAQPNLEQISLSLSVRANPSPPGYREIVFYTPHNARAILRIFDVSGRVVASLLDRTVSEGEHAVAWSGLNDAGKRVASGVYFVDLTAGKARARTKLVLSP